MSVKDLRSLMQTQRSSTAELRLKGHSDFLEMPLNEGEVLMRLEHNIVPPSNDTQDYSGVYCTQFEPNDKFVAIGFGDCSIKLVDLTTGRQISNLRLIDGETLPATCIKFNPKDPNFLMATAANGSVRYWDTSKKKCISNVQEQGNELNTVDFCHTADKFLTGGKNSNINLYDMETMKPISTFSGQSLTGGGSVSAENTGHTSRVFCVKYIPGDDNVFISGGWDRSLKIWDARQKTPLRSIEGPKVCGNAIDICDGKILTGSWAPTDTLQVFDFASGKCIVSHVLGDGRGAKTQLYCAQFAPGNSDLAICGGSGSDDAVILKLENAEVKQRICGFNKPVACSVFSPKGTFAAVGAGDNCLKVMQLRYERKGDQKAAESSEGDASTSATDGQGEGEGDTEKSPPAGK